MRYLGADCSHWQSHINWDAFKAGGVSFVTAKLSQGDYLVDDMAKDHLLGAQKSGIEALGGFFWVDPIQSPQANVDKALGACQGLPVGFLAPDVEQYWADWASYRLWRDGQGPEPPHFNPQALASHTKQTMTLCIQTGKPTKLYTRRSFIMEYMPSLTLSPEFPSWDLYLAQYPKQPPAGAYTWNQIKAMMPGPTWTPALPPNAKANKMAQWSGDVIIPPGYKSVIDFDYFDGTAEEFAVFFGTTPPPPPAPGWEASIDTWARTLGYTGPKPGV